MNSAGPTDYLRELADVAMHAPEKVGLSIMTTKQHQRIMRNAFEVGMDAARANLGGRSPERPSKKRHLHAV